MWLSMFGKVWSFVVSFTISLAVHGLVVWVILRSGGSAIAMKRAALPAAILPKPEPMLVAPPPLNRPLKKIELPDDEIGIPGSKGTAFNPSPGDEPLQAKQAEQEQAFLRRESPGAAQRKTAPEKPAIIAMAPPAPPALPFGIAEGDPNVSPKIGEKPRIATAIAPAPNVLSAIALNHVEVRKVPPTTLPISAKPQAAAKAVASAGTPVKTPPASPSAPVIAGAPSASVQADSESDPMSKVGSAEFHAGKLIAKGGRRVKTVNPDITYAGYMDLASMSPERRYVVFTVNTDDQGNVTDVTVLQPSLAPNTVDLPCRLAIFKWKFEPPKDKNGQPRADTMIWRIHFNG